MALKCDYNVRILAKLSPNITNTLLTKLIMPTDAWLNKINWSEDGLIPVIAQEAESGKVLMFAWMNREALKLTVERREATYWSRSRRKLWHKGEESGHIQKIKDIYLDCDEDVILLIVEQVGGIACHTGRHQCFFQKLQDTEWIVVSPIIKNPEDIYSK